MSRMLMKWRKLNPLVKTGVTLLTLFVVTYGGFLGLEFALGTDSPLMVVSSGSMIPTLNVGDIIIVRRVDPSEVEVGSIIVFHSPRNYDVAIVHRVVGIVDRGGALYYQTKGDNNPSQDDWSPHPGVPSSHLIGVYVVKIPYIGLLSLRLRGPLGLTLIALIIVVIIVLEYSEMRRGKAHAR